MKGHACLPVAAIVFAAAPTTATGQSLADVVGGCGGVPPQVTIPADQSNYQSLLAGLQPGDRLLLAAGTYPSGLPIDNLNGTLNNCIVIEGPGSGPGAVFIGRDCCNTVSIQDSSFVAIRNLELNGQGRLGDAVKAEFGSTAAHHITLENLYIHGHDADQQIVGINTKSPTWNWVIRRNVVTGAGTGIYLGNSDGNEEFVNGLIEYNLIRDTTGYNMQIKHQNGRNTGLGMPANGTTIIRHNVFSKAQGASTGADARPNLLVGHWPLSGSGADDTYQIYGNFFHQNPVEALFQGEGNVGLYDNLFLNDFASGFSAVAIQPHNDVPKSIEVFHNTVVAVGQGIGVSGGAAGFQQRVLANAVFAATPIQAVNEFANITDVYGAASSYLVNPTGPVGSGLDLYPLVGTLTGGLVDMTGLMGFLDWDRDFNGFPRDTTFRGAYSGEGVNPGWVLDLARKPEPAPPPVDVSIDDVALLEGDTGTSNAVLTVSLSAASGQTVTVDYATSDGTASAGIDYEAVSGTLSFPAGTSSRIIGLPVIGDWVFETDENLFVDLSNAVGGTLLDDQGSVVISNDDGQGLTIADVAIAEPAAGTVTAVFTATLSPTSGSTVMVSFATVDGSATSPDDFLSSAGMLSFPPSSQTQLISVQVNADSLDDGVEQFLVNLTGSTGAAIARPTATGTIFDPGVFFTVAPCRVLDTRDPDGPLGGPALQAGDDRNFAIAGVCGIPATATAVSVNIAVTGPTSPGNLRLHPAGSPVPLVSSINYAAAQTNSNNAVVPLSAPGGIAVFVGQATGTVHLIVDINGYFR